MGPDDVATGAPVRVDLASADAPAHDHAHGEGSHALALADLSAARQRGRAVRVWTTVTRSNLHGLAALGAWLADREAAAWVVELARVSHAEVAARRLPSVGLAVPRALHALAAAHARGVEPFLVGFPLCSLGPYARWAVPEAAGEGSHAAPCERCAARVGCPGLAPLHRERFGARELRPLSSAVVPERSPGRDSLAPSARSGKTSVD